MYGFVHNVDIIMDAGDVVVTKAGGLVLSEALAKACPCIILSPILGQETYNTKAFLEMGVAREADTIQDAVLSVKNFASHPEELSILKDRMKNQRVPSVSEKIVRIVQGFLNDK